jgi:predicted O-methyltransferase YrrM
LKLTSAELKAKSSQYLSKPDERPELLKALTSDAKTTEAYNRFLYELVGEIKPTIVLETGTDRGRSAAHMALGCPTSTVFTIDIDRACKDNVDALKIKNIISVAANSLEYAKSIPDAWVDFLFLDSLHTYDYVTKEWAAFRPKVRPGGIVFFDDVALDDGMKRFWAEVQGEKLDLPELHFSGFGAVLL